jgi:type I restriction enzyme S subunit
MEVKPGYKQTEVGIIPNEWDVRPLGKIGESLIGLTYRPEDVREHGTLVLRSSNIQEGALRFDDNVFVKTDIPERIMTRPGDILICVRNGSRDLIGKSALLDERTHGMTFGAFMAIFRSKNGNFLNYLFQSELLKRQINEHLGATINQITNKSLNSFLVPFPPNEDEQHAIADALSDTDMLLSGLDRVIAKKRDFKHAAMQQLLTGQTRLPGFRGEWEMKRFGEITTPRKERIDPRRTGAHEFCVELEHIESETGVLLGNTSTGDNSSLKSVFREGDVLFGKLRAYLRKYWLATKPGVCSTEIWVFAPNVHLVISAYLYQLVKVDRFIDVTSTAYGTHMPRSDWTVVKNYELRLPTIPEQTAIAEVLTAMDAEMSALEARRHKTRALKQAMMQELLTGKIRLV